MAAAAAATTTPTTGSTVQLKLGDVVRETWRTTRKLGEGGCGVVYEMANLTSKEKAAMKAEVIGDSKDDEILKMEAHVLRQLNQSKHACRLLASGKMRNFNFLVMTLLGRSLAELRRQAPSNRFTLGTSVRVVLQCLQGVQDLHQAGFVHRDIKPSNFALGLQPQQRTIFLLDFGLARQIVQKLGTPDLRSPRTDVAFRGTVRYCSLNVHLRKEQGRHDDLWSLFYMLIEMRSGTLPWRNDDRKTTERKKASTDVSKKLLSGFPKHRMRSVQRHLDSLTYHRAPDYQLIRDAFTKIQQEKHMKDSDPLDWERGGCFSKPFLTDDGTTTEDTEDKPADERRLRDRSDSATDSLMDADSDADSSNAAAASTDMSSEPRAVSDTLDETPNLTKDDTVNTN